MADIKDLFQSADWKTEKHMPVIESQDLAKKQSEIRISVIVGKEIPHPNTTEHHIRWIEVFFHPKGEKFTYQIGRFEFNAHGEAVQGPNTSTIYSLPNITCILKTDKPGTIIAVSYCNIHGLWQNSKELGVE
jgi:superoxide reductase